MAADHDDVGAIGHVGVVEDPQAGVGHVAVHGVGADHEGRRVPGLGQHVLQRAARGDDLLARGLEAQAPQLAHEVVLAVARVVGHEGQPATRRAQGGHGLDRAGGGLVAHPDAAVEVQEEDVVGLEARRDGHGSAPIILAAVRPTLLALCIALLALAGCGGGDDGGSATTGASDGRRRARHVQEGRGARSPRAPST